MRLDAAEHRSDLDRCRGQIADEAFEVVDQPLLVGEKHDLFRLEINAPLEATDEDLRLARQLFESAVERLKAPVHLARVERGLYSPDEIRQAAHRFMEEFGGIGLMHRLAVNDQVKVLESYVAPVDFEVAGVPVKKGTWLLGVRVLSDELWDSTPRSSSV